MLRVRDFRRFFIGYTTSLLGSAMASVALAFAVLGTGGSGTELGWVLAARIVPLVLTLLVGGVVGDRVGSRPVMLAADAVRCLTQLGLVAVLLDGAPELWALVALVALWGVAEALFTPALGALVPHTVPAGLLADANAVLVLARSAASVAGPALAGPLTAVAGAPAVLALDAASYAVGLATLPLLPRTARTAAAAPSFLRELREGWAEFTARTWLWVTTVHVCCFNLFVWAPFLVLGPVVADARFGGAAAWGLVMALYGGGAVAGGLALLGRRPRRPLLTGTVATLGWAFPAGALAAGGSLPWICAAALLAGVGTAVCNTLYTTAVQHTVPADRLARVDAFGSFGAFALGPVGLAAAGPAAALLGTSAVLGFGAAWQVAAVLVVVALPSVRTGPPRPPRPAPAPRPGDGREPSAPRSP
ncbi:MFS transporter [Streptomyces minutiscleroticus]|uniref:MFS transporter n=1 Tax=Streptomyces minutiscleroticus TaxID=68238 RepID=A0A918NS50_9ACTN|nr:MFS transporter [Streptomyces minutiscleroticus]